MRALDIISRKRDGQKLSQAEIDFLVKGYVAGEIPDYQISAWLMAVYFKGMDFEETGFLTRSMINSGSIFDVSGISGVLVDKHSTGGVGDKTSLILAPLAAAAGIYVPMMSGRSLGHTGGTLDKLDSIPGYRSSLSQGEFLKIMGECGFAMTGQTKEVVPADRLLYALRDVTATVESIPLITASILSKKFAEGAHALVFDVKTGSGAFMKTLEQARSLAHSLVKTAQSLGRTAVAVISDMSFPLGYATGNFLEVEESLACLQPDNQLWQASLSGDDLRVSGISAQLMEVTLELAAQMLVLGGKAKNRTAGLALAIKLLTSGQALQAFEQNIRLQGGDLDQLWQMCGKYRAGLSQTIKAPRAGYWSGFDAYQAGIASVIVGVGRAKTDDQVLPDVGFILHASRNAKIQANQDLVTVYANDRSKLEQAVSLVSAAIQISEQTPAPRSLILELVHP